MLEQLAQAIEELVIPVDGSSIAAALALRDRLDATITAAVAAFDAAGLWDADDAVSVRAWLGSQGGLTARHATRLASVARRMTGLPVLAGAWEDGTLSGGQVEVILAGIGRHTDRFADHEADLVPALAALDVAGTQVAMANWRAKADALADQPPTEPEEGRLFLSRTLAGRGILDADLDPDTTETVTTALAVADSGDLLVAPAVRRAEALETVCRFFLDHHTRRDCGRRRPHLNLIVTADQLATGAGGRYHHGPTIAGERLAAEACDAIIHRVTVSNRSTILDYGRAQRTVPVDLRRVVGLRDQGCRWPGCDRPGSWCDAHHVQPWEHGGPTAIDNLVLLCRRHHRRVHRPGYRAKLLPDGTLEITKPDHTTHTTSPPGPTTEAFW